MAVLKKIGIDSRLYSQTGVGVYIQNLLHYLEKNHSEGFMYYIYLMKDDYEKVTVSSKRFIKRKVNEKWHSIGEQFAYVQTILKDNLDLMHFTYFSYPVLYTRPFIATVHDCTPFQFKTGKASSKNSLVYEIKHALYKFILSTQISHAQAIITPTKTVASQVIKLFGEHLKDKTFPLYEGVNYHITQAQENTSLSMRFTKPFYIYVGNFYPHKNIERLIQAFSAVQTDAQLVLVGPNDFFCRRISNLIKEIKQENRIIFFHDPALEDLVFFYKHAKALIHPSLSEGFGLPLVEAMYFRLPIIASHIEVFQELMGNSYIRFNPKDVASITQAIRSFSSHPVSQNFKDAMQKFSFEVMSEKTYNIYKRCVK